MQNIIKLCFFILIVMQCMKFTAGHSTEYSGSEARVVNAQHKQISPEIINELRDFLDLIPSATVDTIIAEHYITDSAFRHALKFLRSNDFKQLLVRAQQIPEIIEILNFLHLTNATSNYENQRVHVLVTNTGTELLRLTPRQALNATSNTWLVYEHLRTPTDVTTNAIETELVLLDFGRKVQQQQYLQQHNGEQHHCRRDVPKNVYTFSSFIVELLEHLPRDRYVQMINEKQHRNVSFAQFYASLRSAKLRPMVELSLISSNLKPIIDILSARSIDAQSLVPIGFNVISWGPKPAIVSATAHPVGV